jgi:nucleotide-binding universal stress UspA family protein
MYTRILAAIDGTHRTAHVLDAAMHLAQASGGTVRVLHIEPAEAAFDASGDTEDDESAHQIAQAAVARLTASGVTALASVATAPDCDIATIIVTAAADHSADLIIVGPHHRRGLSGWVAGSVSEDVVRLEKQIAVLLVP